MDPKYYVLTYVILIFISCFITTSIDIIKRYKENNNEINIEKLIENILIPNYLLGLIWPFILCLGIYEILCYLISKLIIKPYLKILRYIATK